jgi:LacI family xylobiose transport system transcriptional regulator
VLDLGREDQPPVATRVELATSLVVRASTGAPPRTSAANR